jgi:hypothetical protein
VTVWEPYCGSTGHGWACILEWGTGRRRRIRWHRGACSCLKFVSTAIVISDKPCRPAAMRSWQRGLGERSAYIAAAVRTQIVTTLSSLAHHESLSTLPAARHCPHPIYLSQRVVPTTRQSLCHHSHLGSVLERVVWC